ncbi:hypothetical protein [Elioraea sp.]|uniref:hypothetical protein n=1 Tax=Elioraea sp. TaxID=2185103 RepID=UPI0025BAAF7A|nr:hypothetical protein [Elioraea sp.]
MTEGGHGPNEAPPGDLVLYLARRPSWTVRREVGRIAASLPSGWRIAIISYRDEGPATERRVLVGARSVPWHIHDRTTIQALPYPGKLRPQTAEGWGIMPGNLDLLNLLAWRQEPPFSNLWVIEDDVRFTGRWSALFARLGAVEADVLSVGRRTLVSEPGWFWWSSLRDPDGNVFSDPGLVSTFLPFHRISAQAIAVIDAAYRAGWAGHHEVTWPTLALRAGLTIADIQSLPGKPVCTKESFRYRPPMEGPGDEPDMLWHPVKPPSRRVRLTNAARRLVGAG